LDDYSFGFFRGRNIGLRPKRRKTWGGDENNRDVVFAPFIIGCFHQSAHRGIRVAGMSLHNRQDLAGGDEIA
jgi:hypothetical protein